MNANLLSYFQFKTPIATTITIETCSIVDSVFVVDFKFRVIKVIMQKCVINFAFTEFIIN